MSRITLIILIVCNINLTLQIYPVILVPGDGGSHLEAKLSKNNTSRYICSKTTNEWFNIWLNVELLLPYIINCWVDNVRLLFDSKTRETYNPPGVEIRVPNFGNTSSVEWLDPSQRSYSRYFALIAQELVKYGLKRGVTLLGAPYDFRKTPAENSDMLIRFKHLIENVYDNTSKPVILICHSMGCLYIKYFLQKQQLSWKTKYLKDWITLSAPWAGSVKALKVYISGDNLDQYPLDAHKIRATLRTYPSLTWLIPRREFWFPDEIVVSTPAKNYTTRNIGNLFVDLGIPEAYEMWVDNRNLIDLDPNYPNSQSLDEKELGVRLHCLHGINVSTPDILNWLSAKEFPDHQPTITYGDGDGSVNLRSLFACTQFIGSSDAHFSHTDKRFIPPTKVIHKMFQGVEHVHMLYDPSIISYITYVVTGGFNGSNLSAYVSKRSPPFEESDNLSSSEVIDFFKFQASYNHSTTLTLKNSHPFYFPIDQSSEFSFHLENLTRIFELNMKRRHNDMDLLSKPNSYAQDLGTNIKLQSSENLVDLYAVIFYYLIGFIAIFCALFVFKRLALPFAISNPLFTRTSFINEPQSSLRNVPHRGYESLISNN